MVLALLDMRDDPVDAETLCAAAREMGATIPLSSFYRILAGLVAVGLIVELRARGRTRFLAAGKAVACAIEDGDGRPVTLDVPGLRALLTLAALEQDLPPTARVTIRFSRP